MIEDIVRRERPDGVLATLGGQTGSTWRSPAAEAGIFDRDDAQLIGTRIETIKTAEDRDLFKQILIRIGEPVPAQRHGNHCRRGRRFAAANGYPAIVRPAFTLGGTGGAARPATRSRRRRERHNSELRASELTPTDRPFGAGSE